MADGSWLATFGEAYLIALLVLEGLFWLSDLERLPVHGRSLAEDAGRVIILNSSRIELFRRLRFLKRL
jgi:hypothetical protein